VQRIIFEKLDSLRARILVGIFLIFFLAIGMVVYGVWTYQRDRLVELTGQRAIKLSDVIVAGLRSSMLQNDRMRTMQSINTILRVAGTSRISVLNTAGKIIMTSDPAFEGMLLDKEMHSACHDCHVPGSRPARTHVIDQDGEKFISTATVIRNEPACFGCHDESEKIIGILLVESSFNETTAMLKEMAQRIVLTGLFGLVIGFLLVNYIVTRFFTKPLVTLQQGFEQVGRGNFNYWVEVEGGGEIGYMADSFNVMSRAIGRFVKEIREKSEEVSAHYTIVDSLSQTIEKKVLKEVVTELLCRLLNAECATLALALENNPNLFEIVRVQKGDKRHYHSYYNITKGPLEQGALSREDLLAWTGGELRMTEYLEDTAKLLMPVWHEKIPIGLAGVVKPEGKTFRTAEMKITPVLAHHIALSFANARLYDMAITDGLTSLYTKRHFQKKINDFIDNFHSSKHGFCLLMLDLDHFKQVNDQYGHPAGDKVLMQFAETIRANIRHGDMAFRYGGEEFAVLLRSDAIEEAVRIAQRIRLETENNLYAIDDIPPFSQTVSIGIAGFPHHFSKAEEITSAADSALYEAKRGGRNQVVIYGDTDRPPGSY